MKATAIFIFLSFVSLAFASAETAALDELNPFDPNIEKTLEEMDSFYQEDTGLSPFIANTFWEIPGTPQCRQAGCAVWIQVVKSTQRAYLYVNGILQYEWLVSTGARRSGTPNFDTRPNGRVYDAYMSRKFPGGDYNGLGNMPYAVFISGGFAIHGTGKSNWPKLGTAVSHGCVRLHPNNAFIFNRLVRQYGVANSWVTVQP